MKRIIRIILALSIITSLITPSNVFASGTERTKLPTPTNVHWLDGDGYIIAFDPVDHATGYTLQIYIDGRVATTVGSTSFTPEGSDVRRFIIEKEKNGKDCTGAKISVAVKAVINSSSADYTRYDDSDFSDVSSEKVYSGSMPRTQLPAPENVHWLSEDGYVLAFDPVEHASSYFIQICFDGEIVATVGSNGFKPEGSDLLSIILDNEKKMHDPNNVKVSAAVQARAKSDEYDKYDDSAFSERSDEKTYNKAETATRTKLSAPTNVHWLQGEGYTISFDPVEHASYYGVRLYINGVEDSGYHVTTENKTDGIDILSLIINKEKTGVDLSGARIAVAARAFSTDRTRYEDSDFSTPSDEKVYIRPLLIESSDGIKVVESSEIWDILKNSLSLDQKSKTEGKKLEFDFTISDVTDDGEGVSDIQDYATKNELSIGKIFNLTLVVKAGGESIGEVTGTAGLVPLSVDIPETIQKDGRTFIILRFHDGKVSEVGRGTGARVNIKTDGFSSYAIAYSDSIPSDEIADKNEEQGTDQGSKNHGRAEITKEDKDSGSHENHDEPSWVKNPNEKPPLFAVFTGVPSTLWAGRQEQGPIGQMVLNAARPLGWSRAFSFNLLNNKTADYTAKKGNLTLYIPTEYQKSGRVFAILGIDKNGGVITLTDMDTNPATITVNLNIEGYAFDLIYCDSNILH